MRRIAYVLFLLGLVLTLAGCQAVEVKELHLTASFNVNLNEGLPGGARPPGN